MFWAQLTLVEDVLGWFDLPHMQSDEACRRAMGHTRTYAERIDLAASRPAGELTSTGYRLAVPGREYLVYSPAGGDVKVDLSAAKGGQRPVQPVTGSWYFRRTPPSCLVRGRENRCSRGPVVARGVTLCVSD
jgi:hypothetical protein